MAPAITKLGDSTDVTGYNPYARAEMLGYSVAFRDLEHRWLGLWYADPKLIVLQQNMTVAQERRALVACIDHAESGSTDIEVHIDPTLGAVGCYPARTEQLVTELRPTKPRRKLSERVGSYAASKSARERSREWLEQTEFWALSN